MSQVIVVASGKGGTGKTTVCAGLAVALAKNNRRTLILDCDSGMRGMDMALGISDRLVYDISDIVSGECSFDDAVYRVDDELELWCVEAPFSADDEVSPSLIREFLKEARENYDYILIDSPAGTGSGFIAAAAGADRALVVVNTEPISLRGCRNIRQQLDRLGITDRRLVINRFDRERFEKTGLYDDLDAVIDEAGMRLIGLIPEDMRVIALTQRGALAANWSRTGVIFDTIAKRLEGVDIPIVAQVWFIYLSGLSILGIVVTEVSMNIAIIAHDEKKELMVQFCIAYCGILSRNKLCATGTTGKLVSEATGLKIQCFLGGSQGGDQQIAARIACNEIDMLIFFRDPLTPKPHEPNEMNLLRLCDMHNIPVATNIATAEVLIHGLERGDLDWRNIVK